MSPMLWKVWQWAGCLARKRLKDGFLKLFTGGQVDIKEKLVNPSVYIKQ